MGLPASRSEDFDSSTQETAGGGAQLFVERGLRHPSSFPGRWWRKPLLYLLLIGIALFTVYRLCASPSQRDARGRIEITEDDIRQLDADWTAKSGRHPKPEEMLGLIEDRTREKILYREALVLGLDKKDAIVKRRLAQKMELLSDASAVRDPGAGELNAWFVQNAQRFAGPAHASFRQLFFSRGRKGGHQSLVAVRALQKATEPGNADSSDLANLADHLTFRSYYGDCTPDRVANIFGAKFAQSLFQLKPGSWRGPVESRLGLHLVWVDSITAGEIPSFEEVEPEVKSQWIAEQRAEARRRAFEAIKARYEIVLPRVYATAAR